MSESFTPFLSASWREGLAKISPVLVVYIAPFHRYYTLYCVLAIAGQLPPTMSLDHVCCGIEIMTQNSSVIQRQFLNIDIYMYIPPSPMSPRRLVSDCFSNVSPRQGAGACTPENAVRHPCTCRIIVSDHTEEFISSETC